MEMNLKVLSFPLFMLLIFNVKFLTSIDYVELGNPLTAEEQEEREQLLEEVSWTIHLIVWYILFWVFLEFDFQCTAGLLLMDKEGLQ